MKQSDMLREQLTKLLGWEDAHVNFDAAVEGITPHLQGVRPEGLPIRRGNAGTHAPNAARHPGLLS